MGSSFSVWTSSRPQRRVEVVVRTARVVLMARLARPLRAMRRRLRLRWLVRKTASFFEFSLCLSRACLGKMIVFIYKWRKNAVFRRGRRQHR
jgi:hypothetical protein